MDTRLLEALCSFNSLICTDCLSLIAADAEEETGGKWRAGDQAKSCRAFLRAIQIYNDGLQKHPKNFDLAYNKARLEFDLSQQPTLVPKLPGPLIELLKQALESHRYALRLNEENADILFNTAQVMISIAEYLADAGAGPEGIPLLREALEILSACLSRQEMLREEERASFSGQQDDEGGVSLGVENQQPENPQEGPSSGMADDDSEDGEEQYANIQAPITAEDLLDTARASINALTILVSLDESANIPTLAQMAYSLTDTKIPQYLKEIEPEQKVDVEPEVALERAEFISTLANAEYKTGSITIEDIISRLAVFESFDLTAHVPAICIYADALVELASTSLSFGMPNTASACWAQLSKAQDLYSQAIKINNDESKDRKPRIYESKGDVEMLRLRLATSPETANSLSTSIQSSAPTLAKNAGTYYRGAATLFRSVDSVASEKAASRGLIAAVLEGKLNGQAEEAIKSLQSRADEGAAVSVEMMREGLLAPDWDRGL